MGIIWYYPVFTLIGIYIFIKKSITSKPYLLLLITTIISAFAFQTNPAWHYGTSGFGPSRHAIFLIPILIAVISLNSPVFFKNIKLLIALFVIQLLILASNNFLIPNFKNTLQHTFIAQFALNNYPALYQPTPEIFVDRTNHTDLPGPSSAIFRQGTLCRKAYIISTDNTDINKECYPFKPTSVYKDGDGVYYNF
jgi:hypothetical protein